MNLIKKFNKFDKYSKYSVIVIVLFSILVLSLTYLYHVSGDGCWHMLAGKFIAKEFKFPLFEPIGRDWPFFSPPFYHLIVAVVYHMTGYFNYESADFAVKFISPIFGVLSIIFAFIIIKKMTNSEISFYSVLFLASVPIFVDYSFLSYVEMTMTFFVLLSVYFLMKDSVFLSGVAFALASLTKYNGLFIFPLILYILYTKYQNKKIFYTKLFRFSIIALAIISPWYIRNWVALGNPIWPFVNSVFDGFRPMTDFEGPSRDQFNFMNILDPRFYAITYFGIFGVPNGNYQLLRFFDVPNLEILLVLWIIGTAIYMLPLIAWFFSKIIHNKLFFVVWFFSYLLVVLLYTANSNLSAIRFMLPAFPAVAVFWAYGFKFLKMKIASEKIITILIVTIIFGLIVSEIVKVKLSAKEWHFYDKDFNWVKYNTDKSEVFVSNNGQCISYNIKRVSLNPTIQNVEKADYLWINNKFRLDRVLPVNDEILKSIKSNNYTLIYYNEATGTSIYRTK